MRAYIQIVRSEPVLLVHGFASSFELNWVRNGWQDLLRDAGREVIGLDLLGHGNAAKPHDPAAYVDMEQSLLDAIDGHGVVDAVGFSLGGVTLLRAAARAPARFGRLVIGGVGEGNMRAGDPEPVAAAIEAGLASIGGEDAPENRMGRAFAQFAANGTNDAKALAACMRRPVDRLSAEELVGVLSPVLLVCGDKDFQMPMTPVADALIAAASVTTKVLRGIDHFGTPQSFGFIDAALEFLDALPS